MTPSFRLPRRNDTRGEHTQVDVTIDGITRTVELPAERRTAPPDWDNWLNRGLVAGTAGVVCGALAWSIVAIGDLLAELAPPALAYTVAAVFDAAWIICMGFEHQLRYRPSRRGLPRAMGWLLLTVSVAAIFIHGVRVSDVVVAVIGALIAVLAKVLWHVRMQISRRDLDPKVQAWLDADLDEAAALEVVIKARRQVTRIQARARAEAAALGLPPETAVLPSGTPSRPALHAVPDGRDTGDGDEDRLMPVARDIVGEGPVPSRKTLQDRLREAGHPVGTDRAQRLVLALRDEARDAPDTGTDS